LFRFNPASTGAGTTLCSIVMFVSFDGGDIGGCVGCYSDSISELCHKCVTYA